MRRSILLAALALMVITADAKATFTITFTSDGYNVTATGMGSLITTGLTAGSTAAFSSVLQPASGVAVIGPNDSSSRTMYFASFSNRTGFGTGSFFLPTSGTGLGAGFYASTGYLIVPSGYVSGANLSDSSIYGAQTFASLGLTAGTYTYSYAVNGTTDSIVIQVGTSGAVPEPASFAMVGIGLVGVGLVARRRLRVK